MLSAGCQKCVPTQTDTDLFRPRYLAIRAMSHLITVEPDCLRECMSLPTDVNFHQENVKPCHSPHYFVRTTHQGQFASVKMTTRSLPVRLVLFAVSLLVASEMSVEYCKIAKVLHNLAFFSFFQVLFWKSFYTLEIHLRWVRFKKKKNHHLHMMDYNANMNVNGQSL